MSTTQNYFDILIQNRNGLQPLLDEVIIRNKGQINGFFYSDIIVSRSNYLDFIHDLTKLGIAIEAVSWWCHCTPKNKKLFGCPHGYGGPPSQYFEGWFSERTHDFDETDNNMIGLLEKKYNRELIELINKKVEDVISNKKTISYGVGSYQLFEIDKCLTPGFNLHLPKDWNSNRYYEQG